MPKPTEPAIKILEEVDIGVLERKMTDLVREGWFLKGPLLIRGVYLVQVMCFYPEEETTEIPTNPPPAA